MMGVLFSTPLLLACAVYGYSITLPFFLDDGPHFQILGQTNGWQHWGDFPPFPFYRPFTFTVWKAFEVVTGEYHAPMLHWLNVWCFGMVGVVLGQLVRRTAPSSIRHSAGILAGCLLVLFPFSYQAVAMVAALFHLTLTLGMLLCLWAALRWLDGQGGYCMLALCWIAAFGAVFSHENGVLLLPLLLGMMSLAGLQRGAVRYHRHTLVIVPVTLIVLIYGVLWLSFRPQEASDLNPAVDVSLAMLLQGLVYPFVALIRPLVAGDAQPLALLALVAVVIGGAMALRQVMAHRIPTQTLLLPMLYGLGWYLLAILPAVVLLPAGYVLGQPRLMLLASVGGSLFWGVMMAGIIYPIPPVVNLFIGRLHRGAPANHNGLVGTATMPSTARTLSFWAGMVMIALFAYVGLEFLVQRRDDFLRLRDFNRQAVALLDEHHALENGAVLVNAPDYLTPAGADRRFLLGTEGVLFVDETLDYNQQFWMNSSADYRSIQVIGYDQIQRNAGYGFRAHPPALNSLEVIERVRHAPLVFVTQFDGRMFYPVLVGGTILTGDNVPDVRYPEVDFALTDAQASYNEENGMIDVAVRWQAGTPAPVKVFVHVYCDDAFIAQSDGYPWGDTYPFAAWMPDEIQTDVRSIRLPDHATGGCLRVWAGLYREADVTRLLAIAADDGSRLPDDRYPVMIERMSNT